MKNKKVVIGTLTAVILVACIGIGIGLLGGHRHSFSNWVTGTPASCESGELEVRTCSCGEEETREGDPAIGHNMQTAYDEQFHWTVCANEGCDTAAEKLAHTIQSITAVSKIETPMAAMTVQPGDICVTAVCGCGAGFEITEGIELEDATLALGENNVTVRYGTLSTILSIRVEETEAVLDGIVCDDTYISSSKKDDENSGKNEMGTKSDLFRIYIRINIRDILSNELFKANEDQAKVRFAFCVTSGAVADNTTFTLKAYSPAEGVTDADFSKLTWNSVDNKGQTPGEFSGLHWSKGTVLVSGEEGHHVSADDGLITFTLGYRQIADFVDENGNILFAFATNTKGLKVGSLESKAETDKPVFQVIVGGEHFHVFDQRAAQVQYLVSAKCGYRARYRVSCSCGMAGTETFEYGNVIAHTYVSLSAASKLTTPMASMTVQPGDLNVTATCRCGARVVITDGIKLENATLALGDNTVTVKYGGLSTRLTIHTEAQGALLDGTVTDDTYVFSDNKNSAYSDRNELGTNSSSYRTYFRANVSGISGNRNAKLQLMLCITSGAVNADTTFTLKAYAPAEGVTDAAFSELTWNSVEQKAGAEGKYSGLHWSKGTVLVSGGAGHSCSVQNGYITLTVSYSQIADYMDENGNILLAFGTNTKGLKVGSLENETEANRPVVKIVLSDEHFHVFDQEVADEKYLASDEKCGERAKYYMSCSCGEAGTDTFEYGNLKPHTYVSIAAKSKVENPTAGMTVTAGDLTVTGICGCGARVTITEGVELENATLAAGENTVTVKYGSLSTTVKIKVAETLNITLEGMVKDDTYVAADKKNDDYSTGKKELGTNSSSFRTYFRVNISDALDNELFTANNAKVKLILTITSGEAADTSTYTLKTYAPAAGVTDIAFSDITWNSVDKDAGAFKQLHWNNGTVLVSDGVCYNVSVDDGVITITLAYSQIADFVDENGNVLFAFGTNTKNLKVGSMENDTESSRPAFVVVLTEEHFHVFDRKAVMDQYLISADCGEQAKYYMSCACGEAGSETFRSGDVIPHTYTKEAVGEESCKAPATCGSGALYYYSCENCGDVNDAEGAATFVHGDPAGEHSPAADDNNCETAIACTVCGGTATEARTHAFAGEWLKDENGHWHECGNAGCTVAGEIVAHSSVAPATETDDEVCQHCGYIMTPALGHTHHYDQKTVSEELKASSAVCSAPATYYYSCSCGESSKGTAEEATFEDGAALEHSCTTLQYDETHHWYKCANGCGTTTDPEEHFGGTATDTQKAICEGCHQPYGELKTWVTVSGSIVEDTYIASDNKDSDYSTSKKELNARKKGANTYRSYVRFHFSDVLNAEGFDADSAKVEITLTISAGSLADAGAFTMKAYTPVAEKTDVGFDKVTWNSVKEDSGDYKELHWNNGIVPENCEISIVEGKIIVTVPYNDIQAFIDTDGKAVFAFYSTSEDLKIASMENTSFAIPAVSVTYLK